MARTAYRTTPESVDAPRHAHRGIRPAGGSTKPSVPDVPRRSTARIEPTGLKTQSGAFPRIVLVVGSLIRLRVDGLIISILLLCVVLLLASAVEQPVPPKSSDRSSS